MTTFADLLQVLVSGLSVGSVYALVALGLVLLYRTTRILNFAHGDMVTLGAMLMVFVTQGLGLPGQPLAAPWRGFFEGIFGL